MIRRTLTVFFTILFFSQCNLSSFLECGGLDCGKPNNFLSLAGLLSAGSCELQSQSSTGSTIQDDPAQYSSFTGRIDNANWNDTYVRKILHTFAWGGPASDAQIQEWVTMGPDSAILQILNFDPINPRLNQPVSGSLASNANNSSLFCLSDMLASGNSLLLSRSGFGMTERESSTRLFPVIAQLRGLNPVRNLVGFMETNYHMATNARLVGTKPQFRLFDETMNLLATGNSYDKVLANASVSAAIAIQYNHKKNRFENARFSGNEDFAREFHQLFFGVLGTGSTGGEINQANSTAFQEHENITVPETAKALTDIRIGNYNEDDINIDIPVYGTDYHIPKEVTIYGRPVVGNNAREKMQNAAILAIQNTESLNNLPLKIIRFLADDNLDERDISEQNPSTTQLAIQTKAASIRQIWAQLPEKNLLIFLRRYALSTAFYNSSRVKYRTSANRLFTIANLVTLANAEISGGMHSTYSPLSSEDFTAFSPSHDVFGGQTGIEARETPDIFKQAYNTSSETPDKFGAGVSRTNGVITYRKPFHLLIPKGTDGRWRVKQVAEWLWNRFIGDGLKNFGTLERAHVYALLGSGTDLSYFMSADKRDPSINTASYSETDLLLQENATIINDAASAFLLLDDPGTNGDNARIRVGLAIDFIIATPYMFVIEGM